MKKLFSKAGTMLLAALLVFALSPASALADNQEQLQSTRLPVQAQSDDTMQAQSDASMQAQVADAAKATEAVGKFTDALSKFYQDTSKMGNVASFLTRFGGLTSAASGAIGILQMIGIVKDPTMQAIEKVLDAVNNMKLQLDQIDKKIDVIHKELINIAVSQQEIERNNKATTMLHYWNEFNTNYCEPLNNKMNEYQGLINAGIKKWWETASHEGIWVLYATADNAPQLTYAKAPYAQGKPTTADNGEGVLADVSFGVPSEWLPNTAATAFDVNSYRETFASQMAAKFVDAANQKKLVATDAFYASWNALSADKKAEKARAYAADILNTQIYKTSCQVMSDNDAWVISVLNAYRNYCTNIMKQDSGANAMLNAVYQSHGFEGEAKEDINKLIDGLTVQAGYYGQFALTCACQDNMQTIQNRQTTQQQFIDTVTSLADKKKTALKGHDNYCYVTGTVLSYEDVEVKSDMSVHTRAGRGTKDYLGYTSTEWKTTNPVPNMLDDVNAQVLYRQYRANTQGCSTFVEYLKKYGTGVNSNLTGIMTRWGGASSFSLDEGITMKKDQVNFGDYFSSSDHYKINVGNDSKIENKYFHVHDKITYDTFDLAKGTLSVNQLACARALYGETHWYWKIDEPWVFWTDGLNCTVGTRGYTDNGWKDYHLSTKISVLKSTAVHDFNGENDDDPFFAFDAPSLTKGVSDVMLPVADEDKRTPLTAMELQSDSYAYNGSAVEPSVKVFAGEAEVPEDGYDITYLDNDAVGTATVTATGKGAYSGKVSKTFEITEKQASTAAVKAPSTGDPLAMPFALVAMLAILAVLATASFTIVLRRKE